ncbi:solute carrier family 22 member 1-like isoform X3 [Apostichopus japonicus]|uniref:solute carrier family 22 member 1-like isoform X3 n=1 Tax=Stichopus japonicus TaxID=307972 RepID=UPI003AB3EF0E
MDEDINIDDFLTKTGTYGWFQKRIYIFVCLVAMAACTQSFIQVFIAGQGDHWCKVSQWENDTCDFTNVSAAECRDLKRLLSTPPNKDNTLRSCTKFNLTGVELKTVYEDNATQYDVIDCDEGWYFDNSVFRSTLTEDWSLVCDDYYIPNVLQSIYMAGYFGGSIIYGSLADRFGRYYILLFCSFSAGGLGILSALSPNVYIYGVLKFLTGLSVNGSLLVGFVLGTELVPPQARVLFGVALWYACVLSYFLLPGLARIIPSWRWIIGICSSLFFTLIPGIWLISESPRWLLTKKRRQAAEKIMRKIAEMNGKELTEETYSRVKDDDKDSSETGRTTFVDLIRSPVLMAYLLCLLYNWFAQSFIYFGLSLGTASLGVSIYVSFCLSGVVEMLSFVVCIPAMNRFGRKWSTAFFLFLAGFACCATIFAQLCAWDFVPPPPVLEVSSRL